MNIFDRLFAWLRSLFGGNSATPQPQSTGWTILYSHNVPPQMTPAGGAYYFDFPQADGVHYVVKPSAPIAPGKTITMTFAIEGAGKLIPVDGDPTARVRVMVQKRDDDMATADARWWSQPLELTAPGDYTLTAPLDFSKWITIGGGLPTAGQAGFNDCLANMGNIGCTFGGWSAGHGVYAQGPSRFILKEFTVV